MGPHRSAHHDGDVLHHVQLSSNMCNNCVALLCCTAVLQSSCSDQARSDLAVARLLLLMLLLEVLGHSTDLLLLAHRAQADASQRFQGSVAATPDGYAEQFGHYGREGLAKTSGTAQFQRKSVDQAAR